MLLVAHSPDSPPGRYRLTAVLTLTAVILLACSGGEADERGSSNRSGSAVPAPAAEPTAPGAEAAFPADWQPPPLDFSACDIGDADGAECASLEVPLDWADPSGVQIELALARVPARGDRIGSLLSNPGGPGGSGIEYLGGSPFSSELSERFDLVSWDPRGVGESTSFTCGDSARDFLALDPGPDDPGELSAIEQAADAVARECESDDGYLLAHVHTEEVTRDLEAIRLALGGEQLNYMGFSYGTHIGQLYAEMFGNNVRSMVLDGVVDPALDFEEFLLGQIAAFEAAFAANVSGCADAGSTKCGVRDLAGAYDEVAATVETDPLPGGPNGIGPAEVATAATFSAYRSDGWSVLGPALADALEGDGDALWDLAENYYEFGSYGSYAAVVCTDTEHPAGTDAYREFYDRAVAVSDRFGPSVANEMLPCATWGVDPQGAARAITAADAPPILVVGNTGDPATPLANAEAVAGSLASGHLVVVDSEGHTAYGTNRCLRAIADSYLVDLALPTAGTSC